RTRCGCYVHAGSAWCDQALVESANADPFVEVSAIVIEAHCLRLREAREHRAAQFAGIAVAIGVQGPARFPRIDPDGQRARIGYRLLAGTNQLVRLPRENVDAVARQECQCFLDRPLRLRAGHLPTSRLKKYEPL